MAQDDIARNDKNIAVFNAECLLSKIFPIWTLGHYSSTNNNRWPLEENLNPHLSLYLEQISSVQDIGFCVKHSLDSMFCKPILLITKLAGY